MNPPQSGTSLTGDAVQTIGGRNTRGDKSDSPGRRNEILVSTPTSQPNCIQNSHHHRTPSTEREIRSTEPKLIVAQDHNGFVPSFAPRFSAPPLVPNSSIASFLGAGFGLHPRPFSGSYPKSVTALEVL
jgi:hypothetical protein